MSRFLHGLPVRVGGTSQRPRYRFLEGAHYEIGPLGSGWIVEVPADFVFDVSAPAPLVPVLKLLGLWKPLVWAAGLHDYTRQDPAWSLWFGDLIFCDALHADGVREPWLTLCWWAVRTNNNRA